VVKAHYAALCAESKEELFSSVNWSELRFDFPPYNYSYPMASFEWFGQQDGGQLVASVVAKEGAAMARQEPPEGRKEGEIAALLRPFISWRKIHERCANLRNSLLLFRHLSRFWQ
jgi:hypothetical protein